MKKKLKLFVWEGVLADNTEGIMFALATDKKHARKLLFTKCDFELEEILMLEPEEITEPKGFVVWGGS